MCCPSVTATEKGDVNICLVNRLFGVFCQICVAPQSHAQFRHDSLGFSYAHINSESGDTFLLIIELR